MKAQDTSPEVGVIALVPDEWDGVMMPRHYILARLGQHMPVVWIDQPGGWRDYWMPGANRFLKPQTWRSPRPGFTVLEAGAMLPEVYRPAWLRRATLAARLHRARTRLLDLGARRIALYLWRYEFADALDHCNHNLSVYEIDDEYSFSDVETPLPSAERALIARVDQVIIHSSALMRKKGGINLSTALIANGVDFELFSRPQSEPTDLARVPRPRIGYVGVIKRQLDLDLLLRLARARPNWSFPMVGPVNAIHGKEQVLAELQARPNLHFLGHKPPQALPAYMQHMDVCLMCYEVNAYTQYIYPMKLHEYLAAGQPTLAPPIETVLEHADVLRVARCDDEWLDGIEWALSSAARSDAEVERRRTRAARFDWDALTAKVAALIHERSKELGVERIIARRGA